MATTCSPGSRSAELPRVAGGQAADAVALITARSVTGSRPTMVAERCVPSLKVTCSEPPSAAAGDHVVVGEDQAVAVDDTPVPSPPPCAVRDLDGHDAGQDRGGDLLHRAVGGGGVCAAGRAGCSELTPVDGAGTGPRPVVDGTAVSAPRRRRRPGRRRPRRRPAGRRRAGGAGPRLRPRVRGRRGGRQPGGVRGAPRVLGAGVRVRRRAAGGEGYGGRVRVWSLMSITVRPVAGRTL